MFESVPQSHSHIHDNYGWPQSLDHEMGKIRCIWADATGTDRQKGGLQSSEFAVLFSLCSIVGTPANRLGAFECFRRSPQVLGRRVSRLSLDH